MRGADFYAAICTNIAKHDQHCIGVFPDDRDSAPAFTYTIGNHEVGLPEILLIGGCNEVWHHIANLLGSIQRKRREPFKSGEKIDYGAKFPAKMIEVGDEAKNDFTIQAGEYYRTRDYRVFQALLPDPDGIYPDDERCHPEWRKLCPALPTLKGGAQWVN